MKTLSIHGAMIFPRGLGPFLKQVNRTAPRHDQQIIRRMRINLKTPFAEKDAVKALGARWDAKLKVWYIADVADLAPFLRWIPTTVAAAADPHGDAPAVAKTPSAPKQPKLTADVPHCGCQVLPWEECMHTVKS
jgi:hypothetical protein